MGKKKKTAGIAAIVAASALAITGGWVGYVKSQPRHYWSDGSYMYMTMESSENNRFLDIAKAKISANVNSMIVSTKPIQDDDVDYKRTLDQKLNTVILEIPAYDKNVEDESVRKDPKEAMTIDLTDKDKKEIYAKYSWIDLHVYDHDSVINVGAYEIDPDTGEEIRRIKLSGSIFTDTLEPKRKTLAILAEESGLGKAELIKIKVKDFDGNMYHSFIKLERK